MKKSLYLFLLLAATLALFPSCQDYDFGFTVQQIKTSKFAQNFENQYGPIDPDQSWDLTNYMTRTAKYDDEALVDYLLQNGGQTRAGGGSSDPIGSLPDNCGLEIDGDGYYHVEPNTIKWMRNYLKEGVNNTALGSAFSLSAPNNQIAIIPIYQGFANMDWSLWLRRTGANAGDTKLWTESENILVSNDGSTWSEKGTTYGTSQTVYDKEIKAKPIVIDLQEGENFNLFLQIDNNNGKDTFSKTGTIQLSSMGMMLALPCPLPDNLGTTNEEQNLAMIVGCEDSDLAGSDWDMNDVCFLIVGLPALPNRIDITRKRYMCEDLGNTYDFDFNDIVVDVMEVVTSEYDANTNLFKPSGTSTQIATMKHVCGTLPFRVKVGETCFNWVSDPTDEEKTKTDLAAGVSQSDIVNLQTRAVNWNPEFSRRITGWNHKTNNIEILVSTDANKNIDVLTDAFGDKNGAVEIDRDNHIYHITFAESGEAPLIIATDPTLMWMEENQNIPESWWQEGTFKPTGSADNDAPADGGGTADEWKKIPETLVNLDGNGNAIIWEGPQTFSNYAGFQIQTEFLDAVFEGYTVLEVQFENEEGGFFFKKVGQHGWEDYFEGKGEDGRFGFSDYKFIYSLTPDPIKDLVLGIVISEAYGEELTIKKVIMKKPQPYTLTVNDVEHGKVSVSPASADGKYTEGTRVTVTATPDDGWYFVQWNDDNKSNPRTITISGDLVLTPTYTDQDEFAEGNVSLHREHTFGNDWTSIGISNDDLNLHQGDKIVFRVSSYEADAWIKFFNLDWSVGRQVSPDDLNGSFIVDITADMYNDYKDGLNIQGHNIVLESITKRCDHPIQQDINLDEVVNFEITKWSDAAKISAAQLSDIKVGDKLVISLKDVKSGAQMQVSEMSDDWSNKIVSGYDLNGSTSEEIEVTNANIANIKNGIAIQGHDFTLVKVELVEATDTETELTLADNTLLLSTLKAVGAEDTDKVRFYINATEDRNGWEIGGFANSDNWEPIVKWTGKSGEQFTIEHTVAEIKQVAGDQPGEYHGPGITINIYNECSIDHVTLVKSTTTE